MRLSILVLALVAMGCRADALRDQAQEEARSQVVPPPERASPEPSLLQASEPPKARAAPLPQRSMRPHANVPQGTQGESRESDGWTPSLRARIEELEAKVAHLERAARAASIPKAAPRGPSSSTWTLAALWLLMLTAVSAALVAVARAHRAHSELARVRARGTSSDWHEHPTQAHT